MYASSERKRDVYRQLVDLKICPKCKGPTGETVLCGSCKLIAAAMDKARRLRRKEQNVCPRCGGPRTDSRVECKGCTEASNARSKQRYLNLKEQHICPGCGGDAPEKTIYCRKCSNLRHKDGKKTST